MQLNLHTFKGRHIQDDSLNISTLESEDSTYLEKCGSGYLMAQSRILGQRNPY